MSKSLAGGGRHNILTREGSAPPLSHPHNYTVLISAQGATQLCIRYSVYSACIAGISSITSPTDLFEVKDEKAIVQGVL